MVTLHCDVKLRLNPRTLDNTTIDSTRVRQLTIDFTNLTPISKERKYPVNNWKWNYYTNEFRHKYSITLLLWMPDGRKHLNCVVCYFVISSITAPSCRGLGVTIHAELSPSFITSITSSGKQIHHHTRTHNIQWKKRKCQ